MAATSSTRPISASRTSEVEELSDDEPEVRPETFAGAAVVAGADDVAGVAVVAGAAVDAGAVVLAAGGSVPAGTVAEPAVGAAPAALEGAEDVLPVDLIWLDPVGDELEAVQHSPAVRRRRRIGGTG
jgi:hypothetical protein